jgi:hypothetical protein
MCGREQDDYVSFKQEYYNGGIVNGDNSEEVIVKNV